MSFSQTDRDYFTLENDVKKICNTKSNSFHKAHIYFFKEENDSAYFYSNQSYNEIKEPVKVNYLDFISGVSAFYKGFYNIAKNKLENIPNDFKYQYLVDYNFGNIALNTKQYREALIFFTSTLNSNKVQSKKRLKRIYHNIGVCHLHLKDYFSSEKFLLKELEISQNEKDTLSIIYSKLDLGNLNYEQYKDEIAIPYFKESYQLATLYTDIKAKQTTANNLAIVEKNRKRYKESTNYYTEYVKWKDSIWNRDKISQLLEKDKQIALVAKDKEIAAQKAIAIKQEERAQLFVIILSIILLFLALLFYLYRVKIKQHTIINSQKKQLESLNTTKNYLLSVISHDLRTPIHTIKANHKKISILLKDNLCEDAITLHKKNTSISEGASQLLNNILNWALQQSNQLLFIPETHFLNLLIDSILIDFRPIGLVKNILILTIFEDSESQVFLDKELFKIGFRNLIDNAIKYTPESGTIEIKTTFNDTMCILTITDTGKGMSQDILNIVNDYNTLTTEKMDRSKGLGLGLVLSKTLIIKNKGTFKIKNNPNKGIMITIKLPVKKV
jgi:signal transduction histidine kinase